MENPTSTTTQIILQSEVPVAIQDDVESGNGACNDLPNLNDIDVTVSLMGVRAKTWEEFIPLYQKHASTIGFSFRKSTTRRDNDKIIEKYFVCSCSGNPPPFALEGQNSKKRRLNDTRTGCKASLRVKFESGSFTVVCHDMFHNHPLTRPEWQHMHRVERSISMQKGEAIKMMDEAGIKPAASYRYFAHTAGGEENLGHTKKDHLNFINRARRKELDGNDAQLVLNALQKRQIEDPDFYYMPLLGEGGKLIALYWRDSMMKWDYELYGDVVVFDTTYKTNRYDLICAPFVGVNNHWNTVMFACAFLADETTKTFEWLFNQFLMSMGQKKPVTIFTDQDAAMAAAIAKVFGDETKHRLCLWHLHQNAISHCGKLKKNKEFMDAFNHCLKGCVDRMEFEESWMSMINKFELRDDSWFERLYGLKEKWCTALSKDFFSAGILSSQRSESTNNAISFNAKKTTSLKEFFDIFWDTIGRWRSDEKTKEFKCSWSIPRSGVSTGIVKHAAQTYTYTIFRFFEEEFLASLASTAKIEVSFGKKKTYLVSSEDNPKEGRLVICTIDAGKVEITCNCRMFEEVGWLCSHCLRVLFVSNVTKISGPYISKRWTKDVKKHVWDKYIGKQPIQSDDRIQWREYMSRRYNDLILKSEANMDARRTLEDAYTTNALAIEDIISANEVENPINNSDLTSVAERVLDPDRATTKGRKGKQKNKFGKRKATTAQFTFNQQPNEKII